jgi:Scavenger mRNA decapping enzyme (DcpS) N-terminal
MPESSDIKKQKMALEMKNFTAKKVLINNAAKRTVFLLGEFANSTDPAIVILEKVEFDEESLITTDDDKSILKHLELETVVINDIYGNYLGETDKKFNSKFLLVSDMVYLKIFVF